MTTLEDALDAEQESRRRKRLEEKIEEKAAPAEEEKGRGETEYVILRQESEGIWNEAGRSAANSSRAALHALSAELGEGTFIAVPMRSWQPLTIAIETKIRIS
jgi:hypothetical protein